MDLEQFRKIQSRRSFFRDCAGGIGTIALAQMLEQDGRAAARWSRTRWRRANRTSRPKPKT